MYVVIQVIPYKMKMVARIEDIQDTGPGSQKMCN